jgi:hypothetical protein
MKLGIYFGFTTSLAVIHLPKPCFSSPRQDISLVVYSRDEEFTDGRRLAVSPSSQEFFCD